MRVKGFCKHQVVIVPVNRGFIIQVGCQQIIFSLEEHEKMMSFLDDLYTKPEKQVQEKWQDLDPYCQGGLQPSRLANPVEVARPYPQEEAKSNTHRIRR